MSTKPQIRPRLEGPTLADHEQAERDLNFTPAYASGIWSDEQRKALHARAWEIFHARQTKH